MKIAKLFFSHPVKGVVRFTRRIDGQTVKPIKINSNENYEVDISLKDIAPGLWHLIFEWEYNDKLFSVDRKIVIR